jgi:hypothetical protein
MHPASYTIEIHVQHSDIERALADSGSAAKVEDVVRTLAALEDAPYDAAIMRAIKQLGDEPAADEVPEDELYEPGDEMGLGVGEDRPWTIASDQPVGAEAEATPADL